MDLSRLQLKPHKLYHHLDELIKWKNGEYFPPIFIEVSPTDRCNHKCHFCYTSYLWSKKMEIPDELLVNIFRDLGKAGVKSIMVQGTGEPLLHQALPDAIVAGKEAGLDIALCTNGVLLTRDILEKVMPCLSWIRISAIENDPKRYAKTHRCAESHWNNLMENLSAAIEIRNRDRLDTVISAHFLPFSYNAKYVVETTQMCKNIGLDYLLIKSPNRSDMHTPFAEWSRSTFDEYNELLKEAAQLQTPEFLVSVRFDQYELQKECGAFPKRFKKCYGVEFEIMLDADGCLYPCLQHWRNPRYCLGDLTKASFEEIWRSDHKRKVLEDFYQNMNLDECQFGCKQHHINETLWELANPPMHKNFL